MDEADWRRRLALLWASIDELPEDDFLAAIEKLVAELLQDNPVTCVVPASQQ